MNEQLVLHNAKRVTGVSVDIIIQNGKIVEIPKGVGMNGKFFK